jgi:hypothetical protein
MIMHKCNRKLNRNILMRLGNKYNKIGKLNRELLIRYCNDDQIVNIGDVETIRMQKLIIAYGKEFKTEENDILKYSVRIQPIVFRFFSQIRNSIGAYEYLSISKGIGGAIVGFLNFPDYSEDKDKSLVGSTSFGGAFHAFDASTRNKIILPIHKDSNLNADPVYITHLIDRDNINLDGLTQNGAPLTEDIKRSVVNDIKTTNQTEYVKYNGKISNVEDAELPMPEDGKNLDFEPKKIKSARLGALMKGNENYAEVNFIGNLNLRGYSIKVIDEHGADANNAYLYGMVFHMLKYCDRDKFPFLHYTAHEIAPVVGGSMDTFSNMTLEELYNEYLNVRSTYIKSKGKN